MKTLFAVLLACIVGTAHAAAPLEVQVIIALSGSGAFLGQGERVSLQQAEKLINAGGGIDGRPIRYVLHDDQSNPQVAVQLASGLIASGTALILGPSLVAECNATAPLMRNGPLMWCFAPGIHPAPGSYVFSGDASSKDLTNALVRYFRLRRWTRIGVITSSDASGQDALHGIQDALKLPENAAVQVVDWESFAPTELTVSAQLERLSAAKPQAIIAWSTGTPTGTVLRGIKQAGLTIPIATGDGNMAHAAMKHFADILPAQFYFPCVPWMGGDDPALHLDPRVVAAQKRYFAAFAETDRKPDGGTLVGWEPAMVLAEVLKRAGPDANADKLRDTLAHLTDFASIAGIYNFVRSPQRGLDIQNTVVTRWDAAKDQWDVVSKLTGIPLP